MSRLLNAVMSSALCLVAAFSHAHADPARLFNDAAAAANQVNQNVPIEQRLELYSRVFKNLDAIVAEFPASPEALRIITQQTAGNFNPAKLRSDYISELSRYYNTICEVNPSYRCLGFVSLNIGNNECQRAQNFADLERAHRHIQNATRIFHSQREDKSIVSLAVGAYNQCSAGRANLSQWHRDYFQSKLIQILLEVGDQATVRAMIQRIETPFFRFEGVLTLRIMSGQPADEDYLQRLDRFIEENLAPQDKQSSDAFLATMQLRMFAIRHSTRVMDYGYTYDAIQKYRNYGPTRTCDRQYVSFLFNQMLDYQIAVTEIPSQKRGNPGDRVSPTNQAQVAALVMMAAERPQGVYAPCADGEYYDMVLMARIHGALLLEKGLETAARFRSELERRSMTREELVNYYLGASDLGPADLAKFYFAEGNDSRGTSRGGSAGVILGNLKTPKAHAIYPVFRRLVDAGDVCNSARLLFRQISKTDRYNEAIGYMINSPQIDGSKSNKCGDAELELLLKR